MADALNDSTLSIEKRTEQMMGLLMRDVPTFNGTMIALAGRGFHSDVTNPTASQGTAVYPTALGRDVDCRGYAYLVDGSRCLGGD
jgi:hypothetical protein